MNTRLSKGLKIGHPLIDSQHQALLDSLENLRAAIRDGGESIHAAVDRFLDLLKRHFSDEEAVLIELGYGEARFEAHRKCHKELFEKARVLADACRDEEARAEQRVEELIGLFIDEVVAADAAVKTYLQKIEFKPE